MISFCDPCIVTTTVVVVNFLLNLFLLFLEYPVGICDRGGDGWRECGMQYTVHSTKLHWSSIISFIKSLALIVTSSGCQAAQRTTNGDARPPRQVYGPRAEQVNFFLCFMVTTVIVRCLNQRHRQFCLTLCFTGYWNWIWIWKKIIFVFCHKRYIPTAAAFGGLCIGALSVLADFMGEFIEFNLYPPPLTGFLVMALAL